MSTLEIKGLVASVAGKQILNGIDLVVRSCLLYTSDKHTLAQEIFRVLAPGGV